MMIAFELLNNQIVFNEKNIQVLVLENKSVFRNVLSSFQSDTSEDYFVFSKDFTPFEFSKNGLFISNSLCLDLDNKKLVNKIYSYMDSVSNVELEEKFTNLKGNLIDFADSLSEICDFDCSYNYDITAISIIKTLGFYIARSKNQLEQLLNLILLFSKYLQLNLFVVPNLHLYFSSTELQSFFETLALNHIMILSIECIAPQKTCECEQVHLIDNDLCQIDKNCL